MDYGGQSVTTCLVQLMLKWFADNWDLAVQVIFCCIYSTESDIQVQGYLLLCTLHYIGATAQCCASYGRGSGSIVLDNLACTGTETSLFNCGHNGINSHNCAHSEDVGVTCSCKALARVSIASTTAY